jgi:polysaccharide deacetylase family protein (PEP-CTERM system associated)
MTHLLTVDLEEWYHANLLAIPISERSRYASRVSQFTEDLLDLLAAHHLRATFFVLGEVARRHPGLIKKISAQGHEIASHGMNHDLLYTLTDEEFREDCHASKRLLEDLTSQPVNFYRAPSWSLSRKDAHRLRILEEEGYLGDSSLQPFRTPLSGNGLTPVAPFYPVVEGVKLRLLEVPPTVLQVAGLRIPFAGGFYLRAIPVFLVKAGLSLVGRKRPGMVYVHPWEMDIEMPKIQLSWFRQFVHYYNISSTKTKLTGLFQTFPFEPMGALLKDNDFKALSL